MRDWRLREELRAGIRMKYPKSTKRRRSWDSTRSCGRGSGGIATVVRREEATVGQAHSELRRKHQSALPVERVLVSPDEHNASPSRFALPWSCEFEPARLCWAGPPLRPTLWTNAPLGQATDPLRFISRANTQRPRTARPRATHEHLCASYTDSCSISASTIACGGRSTA